MNINPQIKVILNQYGIGEEDGLAYLLAVFFNIKPSFIPTLLVQKVNTTNILGVDEDRKTLWNVPLFEGTSTTELKWDWVLIWQSKFKEINKERGGTSRFCVTRMKAFFAKNPDVRKEDVIEATKMYFRSLNSADYLTTSHYFISKGVGKAETSLLEEWVDKYKNALKEVPLTPQDSEDLTNTMQ